MVLDILAVIVIILLMLDSKNLNNFNLSLIISWGIAVSLMSILGYAICRGIASIAESNLYITTQLAILLEKSHNLDIDFEEMPPEEGSTSEEITEEEN
jgi:hypothetical protein